MFIPLRLLAYAHGMRMVKPADHCWPTANYTNFNDLTGKSGRGSKKSPEVLSPKSDISGRPSSEASAVRGLNLTGAEYQRMHLPKSPRHYELGSDYI